MSDLIAFLVKPKERQRVKDSALRSSLFVSFLMHLVVILLVAPAASRKALVSRQDFVSVELIEIPAMEGETKERVVAKLSAQRTEKIPKAKPVIKQDKTAVERSTPATPTKQPQEEVAKFTDSKPMLPVTPERAFVPAVAANQGSDSDAGAGNHFGAGDVAIAPRNGTSGGGAGTAVAGLGRASGAPGLAAPTPVLKTNREAKPIQTARAFYPPMALRMGLEGDVMLKIEVDPEGKVTRAEIIKSAGTGFDEEALKAVRQSRFEPGQRDGKNVSAEFIYIYRFRLQK